MARVRREAPFPWKVTPRWAGERPADLPAARRRTVVVLGHEQTGIPPEAVELLDVAVEIPMVGSGASLNVAVAGSLVLYRLAGLI
jgi:tRNA G18 (ribose-2'-O)-methylase SpoU